MGYLKVDYRSGKLIRTLISYSLYLFFLISCYRPSFAEITDQPKCMPGMLNTVGWTYPHGDINVEVGNPLEIFCSLDLNLTQANDASNIAFYCNGTAISSQYVTVLNDTTSLLRIPSPNMSHCLYYCKLIMNVTDLHSSSRGLNSSTVYETDEKLVCSNAVAVGTKPVPAENINCVSHNLEKLVCNWTVPYNPIQTEYTASYKIAENKVTFRCPEEINRRYTNKCTWTEDSSPSYRFSFRYLYVTVTGTNVLGNSSVSYRFPNYARMIPAPPSKLTVLDKTTSSVCFKWEIGLALSVTRQELIYKIEYTWPGLNYWKSINYTVFGEQVTYKYNVTGLPYPNTLYDFRVYLRSGAAKNESDAFWSEPATLIVKTKPCAPYYSPKTDSGAFEIHRVSDETRDVYVYWRSLSAEEKNGDEFRYEVTGRVLEGQRQQPEDIKPITIANTYALFAKLSSNSYRFRITSVNKEGASPTSSEIIVPASEDVIEEPPLFTNTESGLGVYELSWKYSSSWSNITNFTVFWCEKERDRRDKCEGPLNWATLPAATNRFDITTPEPMKTYQFAISANSVRSSSGMMWAMCTVLRGKISKIKNVWINSIGPDFIAVGWKLECSERVYNVKGFYLFYSTIGEPERNVTVLGDSSLVGGTITGLKPFTSYRIAAAIFTDEAIGPRSNELANTTLESSPDTSNSFVSEDVKNTTIRLWWTRPAAMNGIFRRYEVHYDSYKKITDSNDITLGNLKPYTNYVIRILACTTLCSQLATKTIRTGIGIPGIIEDLHVKKVNNNVVVAAWKPPLEPSAPFVYYRVMVHGKVTEIYRTNATVLEIAIPKCEKDESYSIMVQSETVDAAGIEYTGNFSHRFTIPCEPVSSVPLIFRLALYTITLLCIVLIISLGRISIRKCRKMKEVQVTLPENLAAFDSSATIGQNVSPDDRWGNRNELARLKLSETDCDDDSTAIEMKRGVDENCFTDPYSSGCYTGRSSTTSLVTMTANHASSLDSGTEMELKAVDRSSAVGCGRENAAANTGRSAHDTSLLMSATSSDVKWGHSADATFFYLPTSSLDDDCAWMYTPIPDTNDDAMPRASTPVTAATIPTYVAADHHFPSSGDLNDSIASSQMSNNGYVTVVPKAMPYSAG